VKVLDQLGALLDAEFAALKAGDAEQVMALAGQKLDLVQQLQALAPPEEALQRLIEKNRANGVLARSGLALLNQVLGAGSHYGQGSAPSRVGQFLSKSA